MFKYQIQAKDRKGYTTVKSDTIPAFSQKIVDLATAVAEKQGNTVRFYIGHGDAVPAGWASRKLEFSTNIWIPKEHSEEEAASDLEAELA